MDVGDWAQIASGGGALAAVIVALFGPQMRRWLVPPRLDLSIEKPQGYRAGPARWYHLRVSNPHRWSPITAVRVFLLKIEAPGRPEWLGEVPIPWRFPKYTGEILDFGFPRDCDLCMVGDDDQLSLQQAIEWGIPDELLTHHPPVHLKLTLQARGLEADSAPLKVKLDWKKDQALILSPANRGD